MQTRIISAMSDMNHLQYPIGKPLRPQTLTSAERAAAIATLASLPTQLAAALAGLTEDQLDTPYRTGGWPIRTLVHHIADSHMNAYARMRLAITENWPSIFAYDQNAWASLPDSKLPPAISLQLIESLHQRLVATLRAVPEADWASRGYMHPENGSQTLEQVLALYDWHSRHHLAHITNARKEHGW
jgi:hypothetical protein